jgi:hypothetical protein
MTGMIHLTHTLGRDAINELRSVPVFNSDGITLQKKIETRHRQTRFPIFAKPFMPVAGLNRHQNPAKPSVFLF